MKYLKTSYKQIILLLFATILLSCNTSGSKKSDYTFHEETGEIFYTYYHIKYEYNRSVKEEILEALEKFDQSLNPFREISLQKRGAKTTW